MNTRVGIIGYGMGNIASLHNAFTAIGVPVLVAEKPDLLEGVTHVVLPGVGAFPMAMEKLRALGFEAALRRAVFTDRKPLLGVCLGMQLLASIGEEHSLCEGLGFIPGRVTLLNACGLRIPHIGWNDTTSVRENPISVAGSTECFYYVHSYHLVPNDAADGIMLCTYGEPFVAAVAHENILGVQFHPEKSHTGGLAILKRFTEMVSHAETSSHSMSVPSERFNSPQPRIL